MWIRIPSPSKTLFGYFKTKGTSVILLHGSKQIGAGYAISGRKKSKPRADNETTRTSQLHDEG